MDAEVKTNVYPLVGTRAFAEGWNEMGKEEGGVAKMGQWCG